VDPTVNVGADTGVGVGRGVGTGVGITVGSDVGVATTVGIPASVSLRLPPLFFQPFTYPLFEGDENCTYESP